MTLQKFTWSNPATWPDFDGPGHVFLGRAVLRLGAHMYPKTWRDRDTFVAPIVLPATSMGASAANLFLARKLLSEYHPEIEIPPVVDLVNADVSRDNFTNEIWAKALAAAKLQAEAVRESRERFRAVKEAVRAHCAYERLSASQLWSDGTYNSLKSHIWNTSKYQSWFEHCQISSADAYGSSTHGASSNFSWLFVGADGLNALIDPVATSVSATEPSKGYRSQYLRFLLAAADELDVGPDDQREVKEVLTGILAFARKVGQLDIITPTMAKKMATILRTPDAGGGKNSARYKKD